MRATVPAAAIAALLLADSAAWSACQVTKSHNCVNLDLVPEISQQVVAGERLEAPRATPPATAATPSYTGPTVGIAPTVRGAPTVGYRWSID